MNYRSTYFMKTFQTLCGAMLAVACGLAGLASGFLLGGLGICGFDLTADLVYFALVLAAILPAATVRLLPAPWWFPGLIFSGLIAAVIPFQILGHDWARVVAGCGCIAVAFASTWFFRPRKRRVKT
jgi:hypothetical protein